MKIVTNTLESIAGIGIYPVIGLMLFFSIFIVLVIHVFRLKKSKVEEYGRLPLEDDDDLNDNENESLKQ